MEKTEQCREYYDKVASVYNTKHGVALYGQEYNFNKYYSPFLDEHISKTGKVLELGCGSGFYTHWLGQRGLDVFAMDISSKMLGEAKKAAPKAKFFVGNCEDPQSVINSNEIGEGFDLIVGVNTFSYYANKLEALKQYHKILRPKGKIIFLDMNGASPYYQIMAWMSKNEMKQWLPEIKQSSQKVLKPLVESSGFRLEHMEHFAFIPNGLDEAAVRLLTPMDIILSKMPLFDQWAMRVAWVATK